jgi:chromosome segregation ATPase
VLASIPNIGHASVVFELLAGRFAYRPFGLLDNTHLRFFNRRSIDEMFESTGYVVEEISRIEVAPAASEFQTDLAAFPPEIVTFALQREEAATFQFIVKACPATPAGSLAALRRRLEQVEASRDERAATAQDLEAARSALATREAEVLDLRQRLEAAHAQRTAAALELRQRLETAQVEGEAALASVNAHLGTTLALLAEREAAAADLRRELDNIRTQLAESQTEMADRRREFDETTLRLERGLGVSRRSLAEREADVDRLRAELAVHQDAIKGIVNSWSWKLTAPARRLKAARGRLRQVRLFRFLS